MRRPPFIEQQVHTFDLHLEHVEAWERFSDWLRREFPSTVTSAGAHYTSIYRNGHRDKGVICLWWQRGGKSC